MASSRLAPHVITTGTQTTSWSPLAARPTPTAPRSRAAPCASSQQTSARWALRGEGRGWRLRTLAHGCARPEASVLHGLPGRQEMNSPLHRTLWPQKSHQPKLISLAASLNPSHCLCLRQYCSVPQEGMACPYKPEFVCTEEGKCVGERGAKAGERLSSGALRTWAVHLGFWSPRRAPRRSARSCLHRP